MPFYVKINVAFIAAITHSILPPEAGFPGSLSPTTVHFSMAQSTVKKNAHCLSKARGLLTRGSPSSQLPKLEHPAPKHQPRTGFPCPDVRSVSH